MIKGNMINGKKKYLVYLNVRFTVSTVLAFYFICHTSLRTLYKVLIRHFIFAIKS